MTDGQQQTQVAETEKKGITLSGFLEKHRKQIEMALPKHVTPDRMLRMALTAINSSSALRKCTHDSLFASIVVASQMGLEIGVQGQGYLIPYGDKATFVPGWQGIVDLVQRAGRAMVWTGAVFEGDEFDWQLGDRPYVKHKPAGEDDTSKLTHVYAIGSIKEMEDKIIEVWPIDRIWRHRDKFNKVGKRHYSFEHPEAYARKVPLLQVVKYLPKSIELQQAIMTEIAAEAGKGLTIDATGFIVPDGGDEDGGAEKKHETPQEKAAKAAGRTGGETPQREPGE